MAASSEMVADLVISSDHSLLTIPHSAMVYFSAMVTASELEDASEMATMSLRE